MLKKLKKNYKGMSLMEMIIAIAIMVICMVGLPLFFSNIWKSNSFILETGQASFMASQSVNKIVKDLRKVRQADNGEYMVKSGDDFDLVVYINVDGDDATERVHYFLDADNDKLKMGITEPSGTPPSYPADDQEVTTLTNYVVNSGSQPVFYYYNKNYPGDADHNPLATPINTGDARLVKIHLLVNIKPNIAPENINIESFAEFRNLNSF